MWEVMIEVGLLPFTHPANHPQGRLQAQCHDSWALQSRGEMGNSSSQSCDIVANDGGPRGKPLSALSGQEEE